MHYVYADVEICEQMFEIHIGFTITTVCIHIYDARVRARIVLQTNAVCFVEIKFEIRLMERVSRVDASSAMHAACVRVCVRASACVCYVEYSYVIIQNIRVF